MTWDQLPVETDPDAVTTRLLENLTDKLNPTHDPAGWVPREGAPEVALAEEIGRETAATNVRAIDAADTAAAGFGIGIYGLPAVVGTRATIPVTLTTVGATDTVPAGLVVVGVTADGVEVQFVLPQAVTAVAGTATAPFTAELTGLIANGVPAGPLTVITATATVSTAVATGPSSGGVNAETREDYLGRLRDFVAILRPGGVRASDLTVLARTVPGVDRVLAVDLYDADTNTQNAERTVSVYPIDAAGQPVNLATSNALKAALEQVREVNFRIRVGTPTYTPVHVVVTAVAEATADPEDVETGVRAAVLAYLSPAHWGAPTSDPNGWVATSLVRYLQLIRAIGSVDGLAYLDTVTLDGGDVDVTLPGVAALPAPATGLNPSTVTVNVT